LNPECGYAVTCNQRVASQDYPYYLGLYFSPEFRARRIQTRILELEKAVPEDMEDIHADHISIPARIFRDALVSVPVENETCREAIGLLRRWDGSMDRDLVQPTIYSQMRLQITRDLISYHLGEMAPAALSCAQGAEAHIRLIVLEMILGLQNEDTSFLPEGVTWADTLATALAAALGILLGRLEFLGPLLEPAGPVSEVADGQHRDVGRDLLLDLLDLFLPASTVKDCLRAQQSSVAGFLPGNRDSHPWSNLSTKRQHRLAVEAAQYNEKPFSGKCRPL